MAESREERRARIQAVFGADLSSNWVQLAATPSYSSRPDAVELARQENALQGDDPNFEYRVTSAPVQMWTVEEESP